MNEIKTICLCERNHLKSSQQMFKNPQIKTGSYIHNENTQLNS